jgi:hypothetical protein
MHTFMRLMQAWSQTVAGLPYDKPLVVEDRVEYLARTLADTSRARPGLRYLGAGDMARMVLYMATKARAQRTLLFYFGPEELEQLRASLQSECSERLSTNDALCAHMFSLIAERDPQVRQRDLSLAINYRKRVGLPEQLLGNMITSINCASEPSKPPAQIARDLRRALDCFADEHMDYRSNVRFIDSHGGTAKIARFLMQGVDPIKGTLLITSWSKFGVYDVRFGGEPPAYFTTSGEVPFPWLCSISEGFHNRGAIFVAPLPPIVADRLTSAEGAKQVHRLRPNDIELPALAKAMPALR